MEGREAEAREADGEEMAVSHTDAAPRRDWLLWGLGRRACIRWYYGITQMPK